MLSTSPGEFYDFVLLAISKKSAPYVDWYFLQLRVFYLLGKYLPEIEVVCIIDEVVPRMLMEILKR